MYFWIFLSGAMTCSYWPYGKRTFSRCTSYKSTAQHYRGYHNLSICNNVDGPYLTNLSTPIMALFEHDLTALFIAVQILFVNNLGRVSHKK